MIRVKCPACSKKYALKDELAGKAFICRGCEKKVRIPAAAATAPKPTTPEAPKPAAAKKPQPVTPAEPDELSFAPEPKAPEPVFAAPVPDSPEEKDPEPADKVNTASPAAKSAFRGAGLGLVALMAWNVVILFVSELPAMKKTYTNDTLNILCRASVGGYCAAICAHIFAIILYAKKMNRMTAIYTRVFWLHMIWDAALLGLVMHTLGAAAGVKEILMTVALYRAGYFVLQGGLLAYLRKSEVMQEILAE